MAENSPEELEGINEEEELNSINPLNEEDSPVEEPTEPVEDPTEPEPEPEVEPEPEPVEEEGEAGGTDESTGVEEPESGIEQPKIRRNKKMKYGLKEVADVIFFDIQTDRPVLVFDTSK